MFVVIVLFLVGLICLIKGGDWFVDGATGIAEKFHLPEILIGATIVSIGTTLPEMMVSAQAALAGNGGISYGNAIGSVICNTSLIAAITIAVRPSKVNPKTIRIPIIAFFVASIIYCLIAYTSGMFQRWQGIMLLCFFVGYLVFTAVQMKKMPQSSQQETENNDQQGKEISFTKNIVMLIVGAALIAIGARLLVDNGIKIAEALGVPSSVIGLTMIALGTSLPELVTAITSLIKGHSSLSLGNIIGANFFNLACVSGLAISIRPFNIHMDPSIDVLSSLRVDLPVMLLVMLILSIPSLVKGKMYKYQGIILLMIYVAYTAFQFIK